MNDFEDLDNTIISTLYERLLYEDKGIHYKIKKILNGEGLKQSEDLFKKTDEYLNDLIKERLSYKEDNGIRYKIQKLLNTKRLDDRDKRSSKINKYQEVDDKIISILENRLLFKDEFITQDIQKLLDSDKIKFDTGENTHLDENVVDALKARILDNDYGIRCKIQRTIKGEKIVNTDSFDYELKDMDKEIIFNLNKRMDYEDKGIRRKIQRLLNGEDLGLLDKDFIETDDNVVYAVEVTLDAIEDNMEFSDNNIFYNEVLDLLNSDNLCEKNYNYRKVDNQDIDTY